MTSSYGRSPRAEIDGSAIARNAARLRSKAGSVGIEVSLPADAYGHGLDQVSQIATGEGLRVVSGSDLSPEAEMAGQELLGLIDGEEFDAAMRVLAPVMGLKTVYAGERVSYGDSYLAHEETQLAHVRLGYSNGINRHAGNRAALWLHGQAAPITGRVAMNSLMIDIRGIDVTIGDEAVVFGDRHRSEPSVSEWAATLGVSPAEVTSIFGAHLTRALL